MRLLFLRRFAGYLTDVYFKPEGTKDAGNHLSCGSAIEYYLNSALQQLAYTRFGSSTKRSTHAFFTYLRGGGERTFFPFNHLFFSVITLLLTVAP